jgi:hypothetical protein
MHAGCMVWHKWRDRGDYIDDEQTFDIVPCYEVRIAACEILSDCDEVDYDVHHPHEIADPHQTLNFWLVGRPYHYDGRYYDVCPEHGSQHVVPDLNKSRWAGIHQKPCSLRLILLKDWSDKPLDFDALWLFDLNWCALVNDLLGYAFEIKLH